MPIQLRTDTSAAEHNLRKSWPFAPNPVHFADYTRFLRTTTGINLLRCWATSRHEFLTVTSFAAQMRPRSLFCAGLLGVPIA